MLKQAEVVARRPRLFSFLSARLDLIAMTEMLIAIVTVTLVLSISGALWFWLVRSQD